MDMLPPMRAWPPRTETDDPKSICSKTEKEPPSLADPVIEQLDPSLEYVLHEMELPRLKKSMADTLDPHLANDRTETELPNVALSIALTEDPILHRPLQLTLLPTRKALRKLRALPIDRKSRTDAREPERPNDRTETALARLLDPITDNRYALPNATSPRADNPLPIRISCRKLHVLPIAMKSKTLAQEPERKTQRTETELPIFRKSTIDPEPPIRTKERTLTVLPRVMKSNALAAFDKRA
jgi:hypothetical protein